MSKRVVLPTPSPELPTTRRIVLVEGFRDCAAVQAAVNAIVYVCDGSAVKAGAAAAELDVLLRWPRGLVVLTDPDAPGRDLRMYLDEHLVQQRARQVPIQGFEQRHVLHAFVAVHDATAEVATKWHEAGSAGVENAGPETIQQALLHARPSFPADRRQFTADQLRELGLSNAFNAKQTDGAKMRRMRVCAALGIDACTGKSLAGMLNRFFTAREFEQALTAAAGSELDISTLTERRRTQQPCRQGNGTPGT